MGDRIAIFIDGGYLNKVLAAFDSPTIAYEKLAEFMAQGREILRVYYYNCPPYQNNPPTPKERERYARSQSFLNKLRQLPCFEVREGRLEYRGTDHDGKPIYIQKRVDIQLACDLVQLASKGKISHALLLSGDSDFLPMVELVKGEGIKFVLAFGASPKVRPHNDLKTAADERLELTSEILNALRFEAADPETEAEEKALRSVLPSS